MKKAFNLYISEDKIQNLKERAAAQDIPVSTYIKSKLFSDELNEPTRQDATTKQQIQN